MHVLRPSKALAGILLASTTAVVATVVPASAHMAIVTYGTTFTPGATNVFYFRVPHGCADPDKFDATLNPTGTQDFNARTTAVTVNIPATVSGLKPEKKPGWDVTVQRDATTKAVTQVTWTARSVDDALSDWTYGDFGVRATLNGVAGDNIVFEAAQTCAAHDDGTLVAPDPLTEPWTGVNAPKLTLSDPANKVLTAADLADVKARVISLESSVSGALTSIGNLLNADTSLAARVAATETSISSLRTSVTSVAATSRLGFVRARLNASGLLGLVIDAPTVLRNATATVKVNGDAVGSVKLNSVGDFAAMLSAEDSAAYHKGDTVKVYIGAVLVAQSVVV